MIIVDTREKKNEAIVKIIRDAGIEVRYEPLYAGDYAFESEESGLVLIERTKYSDLVGKIYSQRIWEQLHKMMEMNAYIVVILENPFTLKFTNAKPPVVMGTIVALSRIAHIIPTRNKTETGLAIVSLYRQMSGKKKIYITRKGSYRDEREEVLNILMGIKGVGLKRAEELVESFGSLESIFTAEESELKSVVGRALAKHIKEIYRIDPRKVRRLDEY